MATGRLVRHVVFNKHRALLRVRRSFIFFYLARSTFCFYAQNGRHIAFTSPRFLRRRVVFAPKPTERMLCGIVFFKRTLNLPRLILFEVTENDLPNIAVISRRFCGACRLIVWKPSSTIFVFFLPIFALNLPRSNFARRL